MEVRRTRRRPWLRSVTLRLVSSGALVASCGGKELETAAALDAAPVCAAASSACELPGGAPPPDACTACVDEAICQCRALNWNTWSVPTDCHAGGSVCTKDDAPTTTHACKVAAVEMVRCMLAKTHADCASLYFGSDPDPALIDPIGMDYGLYECAVCAGCSEPCASAPELDSACTALPAKSK
jgi:hypothetical protein